MRKRKSLWLAFVSLIVILSTQAACGTSKPTQPGDDQAAIYAAVVRQLYTVDHSFGEPPNFPVVYLEQSTNDGVGDPDTPQADSRLLPEPVQTAVVAALEDLPAEFVWVDVAYEVPCDSGTGVVEGDGAIITLGNVHLQEDGSALVSASLYIASEAAIGKTYIVKRVNGLWEVVGDTGVQWIS